MWTVSPPNGTGIERHCIQMNVDDEPIARDLFSWVRERKNTSISSLIVIVN